MKKGFTLIELLVVIVIIGILVAIALPNFIRIKDKAKEAEVKQNLHAIQIAVERYAVDSPASIYPFSIMGGDWTDTSVVWQEWVDRNQLDISDYTGNPNRINNWRAAPQEQGDAMVMEGYMSSYPGNPFIKKRSDTLTPTIDHFPAAYTGHPAWTRIVGGRESNNMYEIFGPGWLFPAANRSETIGCIFVHHIFFNPEYQPLSDREKNPPEGWENPSGNRYMTGNFSYWPRALDGGSGYPWSSSNDVSGYTLAGYGAPRTIGSDVYNRNGDYKGKYRTTPCNLSCSGNQFGGSIPCICNSGAAPSRLQNDGGSDSIPDGVVITLDSGLDKKTAPASGDTTEQ